MFDLGRFRVVTFDCYGTLIDWEAGIARALGDVCRRHGITRAGEELLALFGETEAPIQGGRFRPYREVLRETMRQLGARLGIEPEARDLDALAGSLPEWPPFPDTVAALQRLSRRFQLGVISNVDDDLFRESARHLEVEFAWLITAQQVATYKPARNNFHRALERIGRPWDQVLHVAQSLFHDIAPARSLGLATVWVNRRAGMTGAGATPPASARPDLEVPDLTQLADMAER